MFQRSVHIEHFDGNMLNVVHHEGVEIQALHYLNGTVTELTVSTEPYIDDLERTTFESASDGYYIMHSSGDMKIFMKGTLGRNIFIKKLSENYPAEIEATRFSEDGTEIGTIQLSNIYDDVYSVVIPTDDTEILNIEDLYVVCTFRDDCNEYIVAEDFPVSTVKNNMLKADIISNELSVMITENKPKFSLRKTTFRSE